jgi:antitoxin ParD1/3/4
MPTNQQFSITSLNEMAMMAKAKVESVTESEVIRDGLHCDSVVKNWLHEQVAQSYDALKADPARAVSVDSVRARLAEEFNAATSS